MGRRPQDHELKAEERRKGIRGRSMGRGRRRENDGSE